MTVEDVDAAIFRRMGAYANLDRAAGIDQAFPGGSGNEGAVVYTAVVVEPGVLMGVELDERQRPMPRDMRLQERPGDVVVAAEGEQEGTFGNQRRGLALDRRGCLVVVTVVEQAIPIIHHRHLCEEVAVERILRVVVEDRGGAPDRLRSEAGAGSVGCGSVEGDAPDDHICAADVLAEPSAHEGESAGIGRVGRGGRQARCGEGVVDGLSGHDART